MPHTTVSILDKEAGIEVGHSFLHERLEAFLEANAYHAIVLISEKNVAAVCYASGVTYFKELEKSLGAIAKAQAARFKSLLIDSEPIKSRANRDMLEDALLALDCGRDTLLVALGGGSLTDLVGFVAACYNRGVAWLAIPTTLLSMVDASIGGKTGLDLPGHGKNVIGAIWHPEKVLVDLGLLDTLPERLWLEGWSEMLKMSLITADGLFDSFEGLHCKTGWQIMWQQRPEWIERWICWSIQKKAAIVSGDARELRDSRILLNFGHTIGHALELHLGLAHGQAVAHGIYYEAQLSYLLGHLSESQAERIKACIEDCGWPRLGRVELPLLISYLKHDKKSKKGAFKAILLKSIGQPIVVPVDEQSIQMALAYSYRLGRFRLAPALPPTRCIRVPGSKSITNRAILLAALSHSSPEWTLLNVLVSDDTRLMMQALRALELASFEWIPAANGTDRLVVRPRLHDGHSASDAGSNKEQLIDVGNAGTVARFLIPVCCLSPRIAPFKRIIIVSSARMAERPFAQILDSMNARRAGTLTWAHAKPVDAAGRLTLLKITPFPPGLPHVPYGFQMAPNGSSQFISGLLMALAGLTESPSVFFVNHVQKLEEIPSYPFIRMTLDMIARMDMATVQLTNESDSLRFCIQPAAAHPGGSLPRSPIYTIEPDLTSASYPLAFAMMVETEITIPDIGYADSCQGDKAFIDILVALGGHADHAHSMLRFRGSLQQKSHQDLSFDMTHIGDTFMTLAVLAPVLIESGCAASIRLVGLASQNGKECERVRITLEHLKACGVNVSMSVDYNELCIRGPASWEGCIRINAHADHRIAMSFSLLGAYVAQSAAKCDRMSLIIDDIETTRKTWPQYWHQMSRAFAWHYESV